MLKRKPAFLLFCFSLLLLVFCTGSVSAVGLEQIFEDAGEEFQVPPDLLKSIGYVASRWGSRDGYRAVIEGGMHRYGIMQLSDRDVQLAAQLLGVPTWDVQSSLASNIRGAAALLAEYSQSSLGSSKYYLDRWHSAVLQFSGLADPELANYYVSLVYRYLRQGIQETALDGTQIHISAHPELVSPASMAVQEFAADYPDAQWDPAHPLNQSDRGDVIVKSIVVHTMGSIDSGLRTFKRSDAQASAHYLISMQGDVIQMVREDKAAWHAYNRNVNLTSIGIEHESPGTGWATELMYRASLKLIRYLCDKYDIPRDARHILRHSDVHDGGVRDGRIQEETGHRLNDPPQWFYDEIMERLPEIPYSPAFASGQRITTVKVANIRSIPGTAYSDTVLGSLPSNTEGIVLERANGVGRSINGRYVTGDYWWYWEVNGLKGWTMQSLLVPAQDTICFPADLDCDDDVDITDVRTIAYRWNSYPGDGLYDGRYDLNSDGRIDIVDVRMVARYWGQQAPFDVLAAPGIVQGETIPVRWRISESEVRVGEPFRANIHLAVNQPLQGLELALVYDPQKSRVKRVTLGDGLERMLMLGPVIDLERGVVSAGAVVLGQGSSRSTSDLLLSIEFIAQEPGTVKLALPELRLIDEHGYLRTGSVERQLQLLTLPERPALSALGQNYPNPFNPETWIPYDLAESGETRIEIYDVQGQLIRILDQGRKDAGYYHARAQAGYWDGRDQAGQRVASGVYFYRIVSGGFVVTRRMILSK